MIGSTYSVACASVEMRAHACGGGGYFRGKRTDQAMVMKILADAGQIHDYVQSESLQIRGMTHPGPDQQTRRTHHSGAQHHVMVRLNLQQFPVSLTPNANAACPFEYQ